MSILTVDATAQLAALLIQGLAALMLAFIAWLLRKAWYSVKDIHRRLDHLDNCTDSLRTTVMAATEGLKEQAEKLADYREEIGWLKATVGMPLGQQTREIPAINGEGKT